MFQNPVCIFSCPPFTKLKRSTMSQINYWLPSMKEPSHVKQLLDRLIRSEWIRDHEHPNFSTLNRKLDNDSTIHLYGKSDVIHYRDTKQNRLLFAQVITYKTCRQPIEKVAERELIMIVVYSCTCLSVSYPFASVYRCADNCMTSGLQVQRANRDANDSIENRLSSQGTCWNRIQV